MKISIVIASGFLMILFQNCSFQSPGADSHANGAFQGNQQPAGDTIFETTNPQDVQFCLPYASVAECKADLRLVLVQGVAFNMLDTSLASLQSKQLKKIQTFFQISSRWPEYAPNPQGAVFQLGLVNSQNNAALSELKVECYLDGVLTNSNCDINQLRAPLVADFNLHIFSVVILSPENNFRVTLSVPIARWQQMDDSVPNVTATNNQINVVTGTSVQTSMSAATINIASDASLLLDSTLGGTTVRLEDRSQLLLNAAITNAGTVLELKETSRSYIMGALMNATIKARPGALIFSESIVENIKIELLP